MARPNKGATSRLMAAPRPQVHPNLVRLLEAFKAHLVNDGRVDSMKMNNVEISMLFVEHYFDQALGSRDMNRVKKIYKNMS